MEAKFTLPKSAGINATFKLAVAISEEAASKIKEELDEVDEKLEAEITRSSLEDINLDAKINSEALAREVKDNEIETKIDDHIAEEDTKIQNLSDKLDAHILEEDTKIEDLDTKVDGINSNLTLRIDEVQQDVNDKYDDLVDDIDDLAEIVDEKLDKNSLVNYDLTKLEDYLYSINFNKEQIDYAYSLDYFKNNYKGTLGACTSIRKDNFFGRNYDWNYSEAVSFVVKKEASAGRYATIGMSGNVPNFYRTDVETMEWNEAYKILPYFLVDGINEHGLAVSVNVVPTGDKGRTTGTHPDLEGDEICMVMLPSYLLERFKTAQAAVDWITNEAKIYAPNSDLRKEELHFLIADKDNTFVVEFINNVANIITDKKYITNFYLTGTTFDESGKVNFSSVTPYGLGLERYNKVTEAYNGISSAKDMLNVLRSINYTNAYNMEDMQEWWKTEFAAPYADEGYSYPNLTVTSPVEDYINCGLTTYIANQFASRSRATEETWQTIHSSVYNLNDKQFLVLTQEQDINKVRTFNLLPNIGDGKLSIRQNGVLIGEFSANQQLDTIIDVAKIDYSFSDVSGKPYDNANLAGALYNKANASEITRIDNELKNVNQTIKDNKAELEDSVSTLAGTVEGNYIDLDLRVKTNANLISQETTSRQNAIANLQSQVNGKQPVGDYALRSEVNTEVQRIDGQLDTINQTIVDDKAELTQNIGNVAEDLSVLDQKVDVNIQNVTNLNSTLETTKSNLEALTGDVENLSGNITAISGKISAQASASNQLADKAFVNSTIQTATANFRGNWDSWSTVPTDSGAYPSDYAGSSVPTVNDYIVVQDPKALSTKGGEQYEGTWRFKYTGDWAKDGKNGWKPEYQINETPLTSAQVSALNSGATAECISQIGTNKTCIENLQQTKQNVINDLDNLRSEASAGKSAKDTIATYGNIVTHNVAEFQAAGDYATSEDLQNVEVIAKGAQKGVAFFSYQLAISNINSYAYDKLNIGQSIFIVTKEVPDLWVSAKYEASQPYTYTTDEAIITALKTYGNIRVGRYELSVLETAKIDLSNYATKIDLNNKQNKLIAGPNITIDEKTNTISATGGGASVELDNITLSYNSNLKAQAIGNILQSGGYQKYWKGTKAEFNAIAVKDPNTLYEVLDDIEDIVTEIPTATVNDIGLVKPDGTTVKIDDTGKLSVPLDTKANIDFSNVRGSYDWVITSVSYGGGESGYRKWRNGYLEQWGKATSNVNGEAEFTLHQPYKDMTFSIFAQPAELGNYFVSIYPSGNQKFKCRIQSSSGYNMAIKFMWKSHGYAS